VLRRACLSRLKDLEQPTVPHRRYERERPGDMIHIDIKKLGRFELVDHHISGDLTGQSISPGVGWEFVRVCIDRRLSDSILPDHAVRLLSRSLSPAAGCLLPVKGFGRR